MRSVFVYIMDQVLIEGGRNAAQLKHAIRVVGGRGLICLKMLTVTPYKNNNTERLRKVV